MKIKNLFVPSILGLSVLTGCCAGQEKECAESAAKTVEEAVVETIMSRRSVRKYKPEPVDRETMDKIVKCGINAPNGMARESWEIRIVDNPEVISRINGMYAEYMKKVNGTEVKHMIFGAPVVAFIAHDTAYEFSQVDCGLLGENMILAAKSMGIGSCCLGSVARFVNSEYGEQVRQMLDFSEGFHMLYAICFGYPDEEPAAKPRNADKVKYIE